MSVLRVLWSSVQGRCDALLAFVLLARCQGVPHQLRKKIMALKLSYANQGDISESQRELYVEKDGKWCLETDPPTEDGVKAIAALNVERGLRREAERQITDFKVRFEGIDPEEVQKLRDRVKGLEDIDVHDKQGIEALVTRRTQSMKDEHERVVHAKQREIDQFKTQAQTFEHKWRQDKIKTALVGAAARAGVAKEAVEDAVQRGLAVFVDIDDHENVIAKNGEDVRYGKDGISPLTPDEWITGLKPTAPHLWPPSSGGGAPPSHAGNGAGFDWMSITNPAERLTRFREAQAGQNR